MTRDAWGLYREWNPLRLWRAANGISMARLAAMLDVSPFTIASNWEQEYGVPRARLAQVEDIIHCDLRDAQETWRENGPQGYDIARRLDWIESMGATAAARVRAQSRINRRFIEESKQVAVRAARSLEHDVAEAKRWLNEHKTEVNKAGTEIDWQLWRAVDMDELTIQRNKSVRFDRILFSAFQRDAHYVSLEDYVIDKIDQERAV